MDLNESISQLLKQGKKQLEESHERAVRDLEYKLGEAKSQVEAFQNLAGEMPASIVELLQASEGRFWTRAFRRGGQNSIPRQRLTCLSLTIDRYTGLNEQILINEDEDFQILLVILPLKKKSE